MSKFSQLLTRLEEQAVRIHTLEHEHATERAAHDSALKRIDALTREYQTLNAQWNATVTELRAVKADLTERKAHTPKARAYDELHRVILDAHSLFDDTSLTDTDRAKSIHGLIDQVMGRDWFADSPHKLGAAPARAKRTRSASKVPPLVLSDIPTERDATDEDAPEYVTLDGKFDAEAADEDAREFARDY